MTRYPAMCTDTLRNHSLDISGFAGSRSSFTSNLLAPLQLHTAIYWEFALSLICVQTTAINSNTQRVKKETNTPGLCTLSIF